MVSWPLRPTAKMSARRPSGSGISSSTEWPACRISRQAPRHTARVTSGRAWRSGTASMTLWASRRHQSRRRVVRRPLALRDELVGERLGAPAVGLTELLSRLFARRLTVGVAAALGEDQPLVALERIGRAGNAAGQEQAEPVLRLRQSLRRGADVP